MAAPNDNANITNSIKKTRRHTEQIENTKRQKASFQKE